MLLVPRNPRLDNDMKTTETTTLNRDWLTIKETGEYLRCGPGTVRQLIDSGQIEARQLVPRGKWLIKASSIEKLLERPL